MIKTFGAILWSHLLPLAFRSRELTKEVNVAKLSKCVSARDSFMAGYRASLNDVLELADEERIGLTMGAAGTHALHM